MAQNLADGGKRQFILIQLEEAIDPKKNKSAYDFCKETLHSNAPNIFEITQERLRRAKAQLELEHPHHSSDLDFKVFSLHPVGPRLEDIEKCNGQALELHSYSPTSILNTWKVYDGKLLSQDFEMIQLGNYQGHYCQDKLYLIHAGFDSNALSTLLEKLDLDPHFKPSVVVVCGENFTSGMQRALYENLKNLRNQKSLEVKTLIRYMNARL
ncbi:hypothetical protein [Helicobacter mehlei]|nr:hypothetical protein [Helicobacter mehlei]